jgi:hypothetical protein
MMALGVAGQVPRTRTYFLTSDSTSSSSSRETACESVDMKDMGYVHSGSDLAL